MNKKIIILDLDGTFVSVNTFHKWMKYIFIEEFKKFHFISIIKILKIVFLRYSKRIDHAKMKYMILEISEQRMNQLQITYFVTTLEKFIHPKLLQLLNNSSTITILATAAPIFYAKTIKEIYKFDFLLATPDTSILPWQENIREQKRKNILNLYKTYNLNQEDSILYTDHHDDIPLMKSVSLTYLVNADKTTIQLVENENISFKLF